MAISKKSWTGFAVEQNPGTAETAPTVFHPCKSKFNQKKKYVYLTEDRGSRDANTKRKVSIRSATSEIDGSFYLDTTPYLLYGFMGGIASTQVDATNAPTAYQHALTLVDTPPKITVFKGYDVAGYYFAFSAVEKLSFTFSADGKLLDYKASLQTRYGQKITTGWPITPTYSDETAGKGVLFSGYTPTLTFNTVASTNVESMTVELDQKLTLFYAINGSQDHLKVYYGDRSAKITFDASFDDDTLYQRYDTDQDDHINVLFLGNRIANLQTVSIPSASTGGTFTLSYKGQTTAALADTSTAAQVQSALQALSTIGTGNATVSGGPGPGSAWTVKFSGTLAQDSTLLTGSGALLTPAGSVTIADASIFEHFELDFPIVGYDDMEMDTSKEYIQIKAKATARPGSTLNSTVTAKVINAVSSYAH